MFFVFSTCCGPKSLGRTGTTLLLPSLEIANPFSCELGLELSNGRQLCTFLGFFSCLAHPGWKKFGSAPFGSARRRRKKFGGCLSCLRKLPVIHISRIAKSSQLCTVLEFDFFQKNEKRKNNTSARICRIIHPLPSWKQGKKYFQNFFHFFFVFN